MSPFIQFRTDRENMGLSQQQLADELGLSKTTIENYEAGKRRDGGDVEIPKTVQLAMTGLSLRLVAKGASAMNLTVEARNTARMAMYFLSLPAFVAGDGPATGAFPTQHAFLQAMGLIPKNEPSLLEMLFPYASPEDLRKSMYQIHNEAMDDQKRKQGAKAA